MRKFAVSLATLLAVGSFALLCGCGGGERYTDEKSANKVQAPLPAATHFQVIDIPVPAPFKFDRKRSIISKKPEGRQATLIYSGRAHIERVAKFYREHMAAPSPGWKLADDQMRGTRYVLIFTKSKERCRVTVEPAGMGGVRVTVDIN